MASLPSGILVQTAANTLMIAPDCKKQKMLVRDSKLYTQPLEHSGYKYEVAELSPEGLYTTQL